MQIEVTLSYSDENGNQRQARAASFPFSIGRSADSNLPINNSNLSRRHSLIEVLGNQLMISDCGSQNGTTLNGQRVTSAVEVLNGDTITLGNAVDLKVKIAMVETNVKPSPAQIQGSPATTPSAGNNPLFSNLPLIAGISIAVIVLVTVTLVLFSIDWKKPSRAQTDNTNIAPRDSNPNLNQPGSSNTVNRNGESSNRETNSNSNPGTGDGTSVESNEQVESSAKRVMSRISNDSTPYISPAGVKDVAAVLRDYRGSSAMREKLRAMKNSCAEITGLALENNLKPSLVMYAAIAQADMSGGDPVAVAKKMLPDLLTLRATFGTETANSTLLLVAAYPYPFNPPIGSQARTSHPLAVKLIQYGGRGSTVDPAVARSVWYLREKNGIMQEAYDLVIRLIAVGIIAQNPGAFGVNAEPLLC